MALKGATEPLPVERAAFGRRADCRSGAVEIAISGAGAVEIAISGAARSFACWSACHSTRSVGHQVFRSRCQRHLVRHFVLYRCLGTGGLGGCSRAVATGRVDARRCLRHDLRRRRRRRRRRHRRHRRWQLARGDGDAPEWVRSELRPDRSVGGALGMEPLQQVVEQLGRLGKVWQRREHRRLDHVLGASTICVRR